MKKTTLNRVQICARFVLVSCALFVLAVSVAAQTQPPPKTPLPPRAQDPGSSTQTPPNKDESPLGSFEEEIRAKRAIKAAEKDHQENVHRAHEIADLAKDLQKTLKEKSTIDHDSIKKLDRIEKLTKKIRSEAGGEEEEVDIIDRPANITAAVGQIADSAESLSKAVENTPRQVVSASVIGKANVLLQLIRLLRAFDSRP